MILTGCGDRGFELQSGYGLRESGSANGVGSTGVESGLGPVRRTKHVLKVRPK
jgi:hypothetical protein